MHETSLLNDTTFWYGVAACTFFVLALIGGRKPVIGWLDGEIAKIRAELDEAKRLHAEAQATLADYRNRQNDAAKEAEKIIAQAKVDAAKLRDQATEELKQALEHHENMALERIRLAQEEAAAEVRAYIIEEAMTEARGKLNKMASGPEATQLVDHIIGDLPKLSAKIKATS